MGGKQVGEVRRKILIAEQVQQIAIRKQKVPKDPRRVVFTR